MSNSYADYEIKNTVLIPLLALVIAIGTFLRFYNLTVPSIWVDELNHYYAAESLLEHGKAIFPPVSQTNAQCRMHGW